MQYELRPSARVSPVSLAALAVAVASAVVSFCGHGIAGLLIACIGMAVGFVAFLRAHAHGVRDAGICLLAMALSVLDLVPATVAIVAHISRRT